jgi:hypothetical protein
VIATLPRVSRRALLAWLAAAAMPSMAASPPLPELVAGVPGARLQGSGRMAFLGLHIYDIRLWVGDGFTAQSFAQRPLAIEIEYARALAGRRIAERSLDEMQRIAPVPSAQGSAWLASMMQAFPDVTEGDRLIGLHRPGEGARFFHNGKLRADVPDPDFARAFFAIWLSPKTSEPKLRLALLGAGG